MRDHRRVHVSCTTGKYNENEIAKLKRTTTPFFYACFNCTDKFQSGQLKATITSSEKTALLHAKEMEKLKNLYELKANEMLVAIQQKDEVIQDKIRQIELQKKWNSWYL